MVLLKTKSIGLNHCVYKLATAVAMAKDFTGHVQVIFTDGRTELKIQHRLMEILGMSIVEKVSHVDFKGKFQDVILYKKKS